MERSSRASATERTTRRTVAERGATLVEYALVFALITVAALGAIEFLQSQSEEEIDNQAECVSDRPPPGACGYAPIPGDVTFPDPGYSPPTSAPPNAEEIPTFTIGTATDTVTGTEWALDMPVSLVRAVSADPPVPDEPVPGVRIRAEIRLEDPLNPPNELPFVGFTDCVTDGAGECTLHYDVPFEDVDIARMFIIGIDTSPAPPVPPDVATFDRNT